MRQSARATTGAPLSRSAEHSQPCLASRAPHSTAQHTSLLDADAGTASRPSSLQCLALTHACAVWTWTGATAFGRTTGGVGEALRAALDKMVAGGALPTPKPVTAAPEGKDLLEWWDTSFRVLQGWEIQHCPPMLPWVRANEGVELGPVSFLFFLSAILSSPSVCGKCVVGC